MRFVSHTAPRWRLVLLLGAFAVGISCLPGVAQSTQSEYSARKEALDLYDQGRMVDAMPLLEKLAADHPDDVVICERLGVAMLSYSQTLTDAQLRRKARMRARSILLKAKEMGDNSNLLKTLLGMVPEDGGDVTFSNRKEVNETMQQAEADFARGDLDKARAGYTQALLFDPNLYEAALFIGDVFFKQHKPGFAGEWFARAVQIDPNRETAYRYWGDTLKEAGKMDEARTKFIEAVIAEPYNQNPWMGLTQWADRNHVKLNYVRLQDRGGVKTQDGKINITMDSSVPEGDLAGPAWLAYSMRRALWQGDEFKKAFPNASKYRHTLREEAEALHSMANVITELENSQKKGKKTGLDPSLAWLIKIDQAGLLEPFVLLNRADNDIAQDYNDYRAANRDRLRRYLDEFVVPKTPEKAPAENEN